MYVTFPALNDNMTSKREKAKWKTIDSFFTKPVSTETKDSTDKIASSERGLRVIREWPFFGSVTREKRKIWT
jgi:hypothetical protein